MESKTRWGIVFVNFDLVSMNKGNAQIIQILTRRRYDLDLVWDDFNFQPSCLRCE